MPRTFSLPGRRTTIIPEGMSHSPFYGRNMRLERTIHAHIHLLLEKSADCLVRFSYLLVFLTGPASTSLTLRSVIRLKYRITGNDCQY